MPQNVTWNGVTYPIPLAGELNWAALSAFLIALGTDAAVDQEAKQAIRLALSTPVAVNSATDYTVLSNLTVPGAVAINLPAGVDKQIFVLGDAKGDASTNNITVTPNGAETINGAANLVIGHDRACCMLQYHALTTDWKVLVFSLLPGTITPADIVGVIPADKGGTGISNNVAATMTRTGNFDFQVSLAAPTVLNLGGNVTTGAFSLSLLLTAPTSVTLPTSGTLYGTATDSGLVSLPTGPETLVGRATADVLTNKDLTSATNVLSGATSTGFTNGGLVSLPSGPDTLVGRVSTDTLQNKKYLGGIASATDVHVLSEDTLANLTSLARIQGALYYDTTNDQVVYDDGATLTPFSSAALVGQGTPGLVAAAGQLLGTNVLDDAADGYVGQRLTSFNLGYTIGVSNNYESAVAIDFTGLQPGDFDVSFNSTFYSNGATFATSIAYEIGLSWSTAFTNNVLGQTSALWSSPASSAITFIPISLAYVRVQWDGTDVWIEGVHGTGPLLRGLVYANDFTVGNPQANLGLVGRRAR